MSTTSTEILSIPELVRKIRIWVDSPSPGTIVVNWAGNQQTFQIASQEHCPIIIAHGQESNNALNIKCLFGQVNIGSIDINYSWKINPYFIEQYADQVKLLLDSGFNLSLIESKFRDDLFTTDLFLSTGDNDYSAVADLVSNVQINNNYQKSSSWYPLLPGDVFAADIYTTTPALENQSAVPAPVQNLVNAQWKYSYDQEFVANLDTRFYEYVNKKLADNTVQWNEQMFTGYQVPYGYAVRMQVQLIDNIELIKDRHVVDLGTHRGQFLYPCLELGCASITGAQPMSDYNTAINEALAGLNYSNRASAVWGDAYNLVELSNLLQGKDTLLMLGLLYHLNNHYQLLETVSNTNLTGLVIDISVLDGDLDHYTNQEPRIKWITEQQNLDESGWELDGVNKNWTWVGHPNSAWLIQTLQYLGWTIKSSVMHSGLRTRKPQLRHRGVITAIRNL
jgi:hypothetical protein